MLRRRMEQDRRRTNNYSSYNRSSSFDTMNNYFAPFSLISFLIGFGILIHALQWRYMHLKLMIKIFCWFFFFRIAKYSESLFVGDTRKHRYHAYQEWRRLSSLDNAESLPLRDSSRRRDSEQ